MANMVLEKEVRVVHLDPQASGKERETRLVLSIQNLKVHPQ